MMNDQTKAPDAAVVLPVRSRPRKPFGKDEFKLAWPDIPGYHTHWFNDWPGRVDRAKEAGYEHVTNEKGQPVTMVVGTAEHGGAQTGYLMKIPLEWWQADYAEQQTKVDEIDQTIWRGRLSDPHAQEDGRYIPDKGRAIKVTTTVGGKKA